MSSIDEKSPPRTSHVVPKPTLLNLVLVVKVACMLFVTLDPNGLVWLKAADA
jgi:hypothetical protein